MKTLYPLLLACVVLLMACKRKQYLNTEMAPNMLTPVNAGKNVAFAASFALGWGELRAKLGAPVRSERKAVKWMNDSQVAGGMLAKKDYTADVKVDGGDITVKTTFKKDLAFFTPMQAIKQPIFFNGKPVRAFGMEKHEPGIMQEAKLVYYKDSDHFVVVLAPDDGVSEMVLAKGFNKGTHLHAILQQVQGAMRKGTRVTEYNTLKVPMLEMEVEQDYKEFEGVMFKAKGTAYKIGKASQKTVFDLDQHGAKLFDQSIMEVSADSIVPPPDLIFDKPFVVLLQKKKAMLPYFILKVETVDIMKQ